MKYPGTAHRALNGEENADPLEPLDAEALSEARKILTSESQDLRSLLYRDILLKALKCKRDELDI